MNLTQRIKFSLSATKSFVMFIIKIWKDAIKWEKDMTELSKWSKSIKKYQKERKKDEPK